MRGLNTNIITAPKSKHREPTLHWFPSVSKVSRRGKRPMNLDFQGFYPHIADFEKRRDSSCFCRLSQSTSTWRAEFTRNKAVETGRSDRIRNRRIALKTCMFQRLPSFFRKKTSRSSVNLHANRVFLQIEVHVFILR